MKASSIVIALLVMSVGAITLDVIGTGYYNEHNTTRSDFSSYEVSESVSNAFLKDAESKMESSKLEVSATDIIYVAPFELAKLLMNIPSTIFVIINNVGEVFNIPGEILLGILGIVTTVILFMVVNFFRPGGGFR